MKGAVYLIGVTLLVCIGIGVLAARDVPWADAVVDWVFTVFAILSFIQLVVVLAGRLVHALRQRRQ